MMGTSSAGVRSMLKMQGVEFETPLVIGNTTNSNATGRSTASTIDHTTRSMLVFTGALQIHALFDFLLNRAFTLLDNVCDVPILLAPVQFTNAAIKKFTLTASSSSSSSAAAAAGAPNSKGAARPSSKGHVNTLHTLDVKGGMIPGWVCDRLLRVLTSEDSLDLNDSSNITNASSPIATTITMVAAPLPASVALNWHVAPPSSRKSKAKSVTLKCIGGCVSNEEAKKWSTTLEGLDSAAVKEIKFTENDGEEGKDGERKYQIMQATNRFLPISV